MAEPVWPVVWDLDERFWRGTLVGGGIREYVHAPHEIVVELAERGILSSICSHRQREFVHATKPLVLKNPGDPIWPRARFADFRKKSSRPRQQYHA